MKNKLIHRLPIIILVSLVMFLSCEEEMKVPTASTQADFDYEVSTFTNEETGRINYEVSFINKSINAVEYFWDFDNGETSTEENPVVIYDEDGTYDVTLTVTPIEDLHYNKLEKSERVSLVSTIFREKFDDPALETDFPPEGWTLIDLDGDGHNWYWHYWGDEYYILSDSWYEPEDQPLTPDNWIITPEIDLGEVAGARLEYYVTPRANGPEFRLERYAVLVSTTGTEPDDFEQIFVETLQPDMENWVWILRDLDLTDYAGESIHIAFRHFECTDMYSIALTDIHVFETSGD